MTQFTPLGWLMSNKIPFNGQHVFNSSDLGQAQRSGQQHQGGHTKIDLKHSSQVVPNNIPQKSH